MRVQATSLFTQFLGSETRFFLSVLPGALRPQKTVWFIRDRGRMGYSMRAQVHLPVHTVQFISSEHCVLLLLWWFLPPQKPYGLLGTSEEWDRE